MIYLMSEHTKTTTPEVFKPRGLLLRLAQIHFSQCAGLAFVLFGVNYCVDELIQFDRTVHYAIFVRRYM